MEKVASRLSESPALATTPSPLGATRGEAKSFFFESISHYLYAGDTALHMAAAAFNEPIARLLVTHGADCRAKNRRGAQPLHYAADTNRWDPQRQADMIGYLLLIGADPNATDDTGVTPLHRAVRTRSEPAVRALLDGGSNPRQPNGTGSTPLHLTVQNTGRGGSGLEQAAPGSRPRSSSSCWNGARSHATRMRAANESIRRRQATGFEHCSGVRRLISRFSIAQSLFCDPACLSVV